MTRKQLTFFLKDGRETIENIRQEFNPAQYELIAAHVTLCREDEIEQLEQIIKNIRSIKLQHPIQVHFNIIERFDNGKGLYIPANNENDEFHQLREMVLKGVIESPRPHLPHITIMHPRNSTCTDFIFEQVSNYYIPTKFTFDAISLIAQENGGKWHTEAEFNITKS